MKKNIVLIGGGGHCRSVIDVIESTNDYTIVGILDIEENIGKKILDYEIIGSDKDIPILKETYENFAITIGQIKSPNKRVELFKTIKKFGGKLPIIIASTAYKSRYAELLEGTTVMHQAVINANAKVGENCIINTGALIEHDVEIGNNCHISTKSVVNGDVKIGNNTFVGSNTTINQGITIHDNSIIGSGCLINKNIKKNIITLGTPAKYRNYES